MSGSQLPPGFVAVRDVLDGGFAVGAKVSVVGLVADFRAPIPTRGTDWKCQIRFFDQSVEEDDEESLLMNVFRHQDRMPDASCGDVVVITSGKVQRYHSESFSLCTHFATVIHVYEASKIPRPPRDATSALRASGDKGAGQTPSRAVTEFVSAIYHSINKGRLPSESEFFSRKEMSVKVRDRFCELKDVRDGTFVDVIGQIVRDPYDLGDKISLWLSDYTENQSFHHFSYTGNDGSTEDPFGYGVSVAGATKKNDWAGPFGKRSMQVTCFEPHASAIRSSGPSSGLSTGSWVSLRNVQIKFGHNGANLEGYLREDRAPYRSKVKVAWLDPTQSPEDIHPLLKAAIRRKRDYEKSKKEQLKDIAEAAQAGQKRADMASDQGQKRKRKNTNSKQARRRKRLLASGALQEAQDEAQRGTLVSVPDMNTQVKCENESKPPSLIADMLQPVLHETSIDGEMVSLRLPFHNANYRSIVRVTNFMPSRLEDFCKPKTSEDDVYSDSEPECESDASAAAASTTSAAPDAWEWRFCLQLEDAGAGPGQQKSRLWVLVDDQAAQCLVDLDAADLRRDGRRLEALRARMFILWGELEERKARAQAQAQAAARAHDQPPDDSDDGDGGAPADPRPGNHPFSCCVRQYGVKVAEPDAREADAGDHRRWLRVFGLFGTRIASA